MALLSLLLLRLSALPNKTARRIRLLSTHPLPPCSSPGSPLLWSTYSIYTSISSYVHIQGVRTRGYLQTDVRNSPGVSEWPRQTFASRQTCCAPHVSASTSGLLFENALAGPPVLKTASVCSRVLITYVSLCMHACR